MNKAVWVILLLCLLPVVAQAQMKNKIFSLKHRQAAELVPVIQPLVAGQGKVTGIRDQLVVRTTAENLETIDAIVRQLDVQPIQLIMTVKQGLKSQLEREEVEVFADVPMGIGGRISIQQKAARSSGVVASASIGDAQVRGRVSQNKSSGSAMSTQSVTTLEGHPAQIYLTKSSYARESATGTSLIPRITGTSVTVEIHTAHSTKDGRQIQSQAMDATVSGELGEWIEVSALAKKSSRIQTGVLKSGRVMKKEKSSVFIKVEIKR